MKSNQIAWDRLDNTANLFPVIANESRSNVYRMSVTLTEEIIPELLQMAVELVLPYFEGFRYKLKKGIFWYYFEENNKPVPQVTEESTYPCQYINPYENNDYLFKVTYFHKRINLEVFHVVGDGNGGFHFLRELTYQYLRLAHPDVFDGVGSGVLSHETSLDREDSYLKNYRHSAKKTYKTEKAYVVKGATYPKAIFGIMHGYMNIPQLKEVVKKYGVTINQYLLGCYIWAIYQDSLKGMPSDKPISIAVPVDLRKYFDSNTTRNFFVMVSCYFTPEKETYTFEEVLRLSAESLKKQVTKENLENLLSYNVSNEKNWVLRMVPLFIKNLAIKAVYLKSAHANTSTVTNMGVFQVDEKYEPFVEMFHIAISMSIGQNFKGAICSYKDTLVFTFTSAFLENGLQKEFFKQLVSDGLDVSIETNGVYYE